VLEAANIAGLSADLCGLMIDHSARWYIANRLDSLGIETLQVRLVDAWCMAFDWDARILQIIGTCGMKSERLCLEITETCISSSGIYLARGMTSLTEAGVSFAIDDYGTGYTDLGQMLDMPFSLVKFDKKIVYTGIASRKGRQLLSGSIGMFRSYGQAIVAEGIETAEQAETMGLAGCDFLQGYFFGRPASGDETLSVLLARI
jgi:EAL domain-containing protein (putative c-di-GMP-specific phosphodiesterase class I)